MNRIWLIMLRRKGDINSHFCLNPCIMFHIRILAISNLLWF